MQLPDGMSEMTPRRTGPPPSHCLGDLRKPESDRALRTAGRVLMGSITDSIVPRGQTGDHQLISLAHLAPAEDNDTS
jgi:hypothetical protein